MMHLVWQFIVKVVYVELDLLAYIFAHLYVFNYFRSRLVKNVSLDHVTSRTLNESPVFSFDNRE